MAVFTVLAAITYRHDTRTTEAFARAFEDVAPDIAEVFGAGIQPLLSLVEQQSIDPMLGLDVGTLNRTIDAFATVPLVQSAVFVGADETVLAPGDEFIPDDLAQFEPLPERLRLVEEPRVRLVEPRGEMLIYSHPFVDQGDYLGRLQVVFEIGHLDELRESIVGTGRRLRDESRARAWQIIAMTVPASLAVFALCVYLLRRVVRQLASLGAASRALGEGDWTASLGQLRNDEVGDLQHSFASLRHELWQERQQTDQLLDKLSNAAYYDALTGLANRKLFTEQLEFALSYARRHHAPFALMFIDLDGFKKVNDTLGHDAGDELLQVIGARLSTCVRNSDRIAIATQDSGTTLSDDGFVARLGGDEFIVMLGGVDTPGPAEVVAKRILESLGTPIRLSKGEAHTTPSIGITLYAGETDTADAMLQRADDAMYQAKRGGKNTYLFAESLEERAQAMS